MDKAVCVKQANIATIGISHAVEFYCIDRLTRMSCMKDRGWMVTPIYSK